MCGSESLRVPLLDAEWKTMVELWMHFLLGCSPPWAKWDVPPGCLGTERPLVEDMVLSFIHYLISEPQILL